MYRQFCVTVLVVLLLAQWHQEQTITVDVDLVNVYFTVCNRKGRLVTTLDRNNFAVFEDGAPQVITNFSREADVPLRVAILMDTSGSVRDKLRLEQEAIIEFLYAALRGDRDKAALFTFDHDINLRQNYTNEAGSLANAVRSTHAGGGTRLYDALHFVVSQGSDDIEQRKVVVVITDGDDKSSRHSPTEVMELAQHNNVMIYAISINGLEPKSDTPDTSDRILETIATETGGIALFPTKVKKLPAVFNLINDELRSQYSLAYRSTNPSKDGTFRTIQIYPKSHQYSVRSRSGYFAPRQLTAEKR
jgi:Ca-activated chloride channel family protein